LQILQHGQFLRFNAMTGLLSSGWPFLVFAYLAYLLRRGGEAPKDSKAPQRR
jgi:hypothetical protein